MKIINVGIVGLGRISSDHAKSFTDRPGKFRLVALADNDPQRRQAAWAPHESMKDPAIARYASLEELIAHPGIDMISICTRHPDHVPMAVKCLRAGKSVIVEKPVATSVAEFDDLMAEAGKSTGRVFFRHNRYYEKIHRKALEVMGSGLIGEIHTVKLHVACGFVRRNDWMTMPEYFGGLLSNWGPHMIYQGLEYIDSPVRDIWADVRRIISIGEGDDSFQVILKGENGRTVDIQVTGASASPCDSLEVIGSRGTLVGNAARNRLTARYLEPWLKLRELRPHPENPPMQYGNFDETLAFISSEFEGLSGFDLSPLFDAIYADYVNGTPYPIKDHLVREVVRITEEAFRISGFAPIKKFVRKGLN